VTDGASSPWRVVIQTFGGHYSSAVIVHDWLYTLLNLGTPSLAAPTRVEADAILFEVMKKCQVHVVVRWLLWLAVEAFGGPSLRWIGVRP
jgi:hypothetical protein